MKVGPIRAEDDGWWRQIVDDDGRMWTIRIRIVRVAAMDVYECWVNDVLIPTYGRREPRAEERCPESIFAVGMQYIKGRTRAP